MGRAASRSQSRISRSWAGVGFAPSLGEVALDVVDGAGHDVHLVVQVVELVLGDDQLVLAERHLLGALTADPVPLATGVRTELAGSAAAPRRQDPPAPLAAGGPLLRRRIGIFRHDESMSRSVSFMSSPAGLHDRPGQIAHGGPTS